MQCVRPRTILNPVCTGLPFAFDADGKPVFDGGEQFPETIQVPCGKCIVCQENRRNDWQARMELEARNSVVSYFGTLTYNEENYPGQLVKADLQKFWKRLRKRTTCRYFACGEYGANGRGHYHFIAFLDHLVILEAFEALVSVCWPFGFVMVKEANLDNMRYVAKYTIKQSFTVPIGKEAPFAVMSRDPGIGYEGYQGILDYRHDFIQLSSGTRRALPRYLLGKLDPVEAIQIRRIRTEVAERLPQLSDTARILRAENLERALIRKYIRKHGRIQKLDPDTAGTQDAEL